MSFRTAEAEGEKPSPQAVWVDEYTPIVTVVYEINGTVFQGAYKKKVGNLVTGEYETEQTPEQKALYDAWQELGRSMEDLDAPYRDDWDTVTGTTTTQTFRFVKTGGHWETPKDEAERQKLYSYNKSEAKDFPDIVSFSPESYIFTCADGKEYTSKKAAYNSGSKIVSFRYGDIADRDKRVDDLDRLIRDAGGDPDNAWCYTGETLQTMDGNNSNQ